MIVPIQHTVDCELPHRKSRQKCIKITSENVKRVYYDCKVGEKLILNNKSAYKYETLIMVHLR